MADFESSGGAFASTVGDEQDDEREADEEACSDESDRDRECIMPFGRVVSSHDAFGKRDVSIMVSIVVLTTMMVSSSLVETASDSIFGVVYARC